MAEEEGITVKKENFSEWFSQVVQKANLADIRFGVQGFVPEFVQRQFIKQSFSEVAYIASYLRCNGCELDSICQMPKNPNLYDFQR